MIAETHLKAIAIAHENGVRIASGADLLTLRVNPVADIAALADPANITGVWRAGLRVKG